MTQYTRINSSSAQRLITLFDEHLLFVKKGRSYIEVDTSDNLVHYMRKSEMFYKKEE